MKIRNHRLIRDDGAAVAFVASPNVTKGNRGRIQPEYLVMHYTAGASAQSSINWLTNRESEASAHLVIARDGAVTQLVPFNRKAWHAGPSRWAGRSGLNSISIGIELANAGPLVRRANGWTTGWGAAVADEDVVEAAHDNGGSVRGWQAYPTPQLESALDVAAVLGRHYRLSDVVGHDDIAPARKEDPGPAFPKASFRSAVIGRAEDGPELIETTTAVNIRAGPGTGHEKLPVSPLPPATRLEVVSVQGVWREVNLIGAVDGETNVQGWVHGGFVAPVGSGARS
ncbi:MAG: N-acetylmuramoyl-L-alanine amidase [Alphaproteobacteria bacterium]|jgi:N-acetylmuramoyl-L-alanine amidase|nr:N-acetylmuramoyl-L-alanine amidase [Alphaproteobacteria bacterium]MDP6516571.1 N-acetylmuramoyl-L-alanine amidase [Alphaproteobacteria bacterium]